MSELLSADRAISWLRYLYDPRGRASRMEMWLFYLGYGVYVGVVFLAFMAVTDPGSDFGEPPSHLIAALVPGMLAVVIAAIRRLHDRSRQGWWLAVFFLPPVIVLFAASQLYRFVESGAVGVTAFEAVLIPTFMISGIPMFWGVAELFVLKGASAPNRFGPDPLAAASGESDGAGGIAA